jgi:hypothetical protein
MPARTLSAMDVVSFLSSTPGRVTRIVVGLVLIVIGALMGGTAWIAVAIGLVPLLAGSFDVCLLAPLFHRPLSGKRLRSDDD